jgi:large subunit ribosomal protein L1
MAEAKKKTTKTSAKAAPKAAKAKATPKVPAKVTKKVSDVTTKSIAKKAIKFVDAVEVIPATPEANPVAETPKTEAKAGKRSHKALEVAEEKAIKEERKAKVSANEAKSDEPKAKPVIKVRSRLERRGKKYRTAVKEVDLTKAYTLKEGLGYAVKTSTTKFDSTVEMHIRLYVDPKQSDQNIRSSLVLPAGTGKSIKVAVFTEADKVELAKKAGADFAGSDDFLQQLEKNIVDFDILIATPAVMPKLGKYARLLGPKGLMPNPKSGTVTTDIEKAITEAKAGRIEYRVDSNGIVHCGIGKVSFGADKLSNNAEALIASIKASKPASIKGSYIHTVFVTTSMGPSFKISITD